MVRNSNGSIQVACFGVIVELPEEDVLDQALWTLRVNPCFYENFYMENNNPHILDI